MSNLQQEDDDAFLYGDSEGVPSQDERHVYEEGSNGVDFAAESRFTGATASRVVGFDENDADETQEDVDHNGLHEYGEHEAGGGGDATPSAHDEIHAENGNGEATKSDASADDDDDEDEESDESDDDDFNVIIDLKKPALGGQSPPRGTTGKIATTAPNAGNNNANAAKAKGVDLEAQGSINDQPTFDFDLQSINDEDKPWRKPGADITDYFNYGFNEESWIAYCTKQKKIRAENASNKMIPGMTNIIGQPIGLAPPLLSGANQMGGGPGPNMNAPNGGQQFMTRVYASANRPPMMPLQQVHMHPGQQGPPRKMGQIDVIGSSDSTSRRPAHEVDMNMPNPIAVVGGAPSNFPPHVNIPDFTGPPPNWPGGPTGPPIGMPPMRMPPPGHQRMPHSMPMNFPPYHNYPPQHGMHVERPNLRPPVGPHFGFMPQMVRNPMNQPNPQWEKPQMEPYFERPERSSPSRSSRSPPSNKSPRSRSKTPVDKYKEESKYKPHSREYNRGDYDRDHRRSPERSPRRTYRSHRDYDRRDERDRDYERRDYREKSKSKDKSRSRDRDDKYKRRRKSETEDDYRSGKLHKRSKKSRKGRESAEREGSSITQAPGADIAAGDLSVKVKQEPVVKTDA